MPKAITSHPALTRYTPTPNLIRLPTELLLLICETITDPLDLHALRLTHPRLNNTVAPRFNALYNRNWLFDVTYRQLPIMCHSCDHDPILSSLPTHNDLLHGPQLIYDALLFHAGTHNHLRHAASILRQSYPSPVWLIPGTVHCIKWDRWQQALSTCAKHGYTRMLALLLHTRPPTFLPGMRMRAIPVHWAVISGNMPELELLLSAGIPLDEFDMLGVTPLFLAVRAHRVDMVSLLLRAGAKAYAVDTLGNTQRAEPLLAAASGSGEKKGWCQRMIWEPIFRGARLSCAVSARQLRAGPDVPDVAGVVDGGEHVLMRNLGLEEGDSVLHCVARVDRRECGVECEVWKGDRRWIGEEEVWGDLVEHGAKPGWLGAYGVTAQALWEVKVKRMVREREERGVDGDGDVIMNGM